MSELYNKVLKPSTKTESLHSYVDHYEDIEVKVNNIVTSASNDATDGHTEHIYTQQVRRYAMKFVTYLKA